MTFGEKFADAFIYQYCKEMSGLEVLIPLSIDTPKGLKIDSYDSNKLKVKYLS